MEKLVAILKQVKPDVDFENETGLISNGILDSLDIITIVNMLSDEFSCELDMSDLEPENMDSVEAIWETINGAI